MRSGFFQFPLFGLLAWLAVCPAQAQDTAGVYVDREHPRPWWSLLRPARRNPADQLAYARELRDGGHTFRAARHYRALVASWPSSEQAAAAQYELATLYDARHQYTKAFEAYQALNDRYPGRQPYETILARQFALAKTVMDRRKIRFLFGGFRAPEDAIPMFETLVRQAPRWPPAAEAQFLIGCVYESNGDHVEAALAFSEVQYRFPDSPWAPEAAFRRARCLYRLSRSTPHDVELADDAWHALRQFIRDQPDSPFLAEAREAADDLYQRRAREAFDVARYYDRHGRGPAAARIAYQRVAGQFPGTDWARRAEARLKELPPASPETTP